MSRRLALHKQALAASKIQGLARGHMARQWVRRYKAFKSQAIVKIQRAWREYNERVVVPRKRHEAIVANIGTVQKFCKGYLVCKFYQKERSVIKIDETARYFEYIKNKMEMDAICLIIYNMKKHLKKMKKKRAKKKKGKKGKKGSKKKRNTTTTGDLSSMDLNKTGMSAISAVDRNSSIISERTDMEDKGEDDDDDLDRAPENQEFRLEINEGDEESMFNT